MHQQFLDLFTRIESAEDLDALKSIIGELHEFQKFEEDFKKKYPEIDLRISKTEVEDLIAKEYLKENLTINPNRAGKFTSFERLLLSVLWKNGHFDRVQPILQGIMYPDANNYHHGFIFRQFGRSLADETEPIVDQHVLRAFCTAKQITVKKRKAAFTSEDQLTIKKYRKWFNEILEKVNPNEKAEFKYLLDKILFFIGKDLDK